METEKTKLNEFFPNIFVSNFDSCLFIATGNIVNQIGTHSMLKEAFNFDFILFFLTSARKQNGGHPYFILNYP